MRVAQKLALAVTKILCFFLIRQLHPIIRKLLLKLSHAGQVPNYSK